ncbi:hypothetical protein ATANTOWER_023297 [Ataeniobius toweri]|uniref:Uncharacterized protein n=1 Tax=Ataeniobius toweri TaxID=208326 RepID=A0ABU7B557_9TELE|nr:hypothetical protein [Ataeniobius toweri]
MRNRALSVSWCTAPTAQRFCVDRIPSFPKAKAYISSKTTLHNRRESGESNSRRHHRDPWNHPPSFHLLISDHCLPDRLAAYSLSETLAQPRSSPYAHTLLNDHTTVGTEDKRQ